MRKSRRFEFVGVALLLLARPGIAAAQQASPVASGKPGVDSSSSANPKAQVLIRISGDAGRSTSQPTTGDLAVEDNGRPANVEGLRPVNDEPLTFAVLVDISGSTRTNEHSQVAAVTELIQKLLAGGNRGYLVLFNDRPFASNHFVNLETVTRSLQENSARRGSTALYDAILMTCANRLTGTIAAGSPRRAIFVFSDGDDDASRATADQAVATVQQQGIPIFAVIDSEKPKTSLAKKGVSKLRALSLQSGGDVAFLNEAGNPIARILDSLNQQFLMSFDPTPGAAAQLHSLTVKSVATGIAVSAPARYFAP